MQPRRGDLGHRRQAAWVGVAWQEACREALLREVALAGETILGVGGLGRETGKIWLRIKDKSKAKKNTNLPGNREGDESTNGLRNHKNHSRQKQDASTQPWDSVGRAATGGKRNS